MIKKYNDFRKRILFIILCVSVVNLSCQSAPTDLRAFAPAETLVYLETGDLGKTLIALTENETFKKLAASKKDFSALENVQFAVAVTGFETSEKQITESQAVLNFKPRFVALADTHAWQFQTISLVENQIGEFVNEVYGGEVSLEISDRSDGKWFVWTAQDGRRAFAFVESSLIFFGNDAGSIEKVLAVRRGEADSLVKNESFVRAYNENKSSLAFGYISSDGVAQIANIAGISAAVEAAEDDAPRSFIARILPQIVQKSVAEIVWTANKTERGIEDVFHIKTTKEVSSALKETLVPAGEAQTDMMEFLPADVFSVTRYNLKDPQLAWRGLLLATAKQVDSASANLLIAFSDSLFMPYGVSNSELFLSAIGSEIITARFDAEGEKSAAVVSIKDLEKIKKSLSEEIKLKKPPEKQGDAEIWKSGDGNSGAVLVGDKLILGDTESLLKSLEARQSGQNFAGTGRLQNLSSSKAIAVTFSNDTDSAEAVVKILGNLKSGQKGLTTYQTETRFSENLIERKTVSPFGFIGTILEQFETGN